MIFEEKTALSEVGNRRKRIVLSLVSSKFCRTTLGTIAQKWLNRKSSEIEWRKNAWKKQITTNVVMVRLMTNGIKYHGCLQEYRKQNC